jgi:hypothetical protein
MYTSHLGLLQSDMGHRRRSKLLALILGMVALLELVAIEEQKDWFVNCSRFQKEVVIQ